MKPRKNINHTTKESKKIRVKIKKKKTNKRANKCF